MGATNFVKREIRLEQYLASQVSFSLKRVGRNHFLLFPPTVVLDGVQNCAERFKLYPVSPSLKSQRGERFHTIK